MYFTIIVNQVLILAFLAFIGVIAAKFKVINEQVKNSIAAIVFNITLPLLIITSVTKIDINKEILQNSILVFILSIIGISLLFATGNLTKLVLKLKGKKADVHVIHTMFGNVAFLGYPLFSSLFPGGEGLLYAIIYHFSQDIFIWTIGVYIFNKHKSGSFKESIKHLVNPNTISFTIGVLMLVIGLKIPKFIYKPLYEMGHTTIYLAMLYIGAVLSQNPMLSAFRKIEIYVLSFNKMALVPIILLSIIWILSFLGISLGNTARTVLVMQTAMPCMAMIVVLAKKYGSDDVHATENLFLTTSLSLGILPFIYFLVQFFN